MSFDLQLGLIVCAVVSALARRRLNILIFSVNHLILIRGFQNLELNGQPPSYHYLPPSLFSPSALEDASEITGLGTVMLLAAAIVPWRSKLRVEPLPAVPPAWLWVVGAYFVYLFFAVRTVFQTVYGSADQTVYGASAGGGIYVLAWGAVITELRRRVDAGLLTPMRAMGIVLGVVFFLDFIKGSTGLATGVIITAGFLVMAPGLMRESSQVPATAQETMQGESRSKGLRTLAWTVAGMGAVAFVVVMIRSMRSHVARVGVERAMAMAFESLSNLGAESQGEGLEAAANGTQGAAHVLMCRFLYDVGFSRDWRSIWGPIEYTFKPSVLIVPLGLERSREAAWELSDYFIHGGGINTFGEFYWNGGYFCLVVAGGALIAFLLMVDVKARTSWFWFVIACAVGPGLVQAYGYGFAQVFRGIANGFVFLMPAIAYLRYVEHRSAKLTEAARRAPRLAHAPRPVASPGVASAGAASPGPS